MTFFIKSALTLSLPPFFVTILILIAAFLASKRNLQTLSHLLSSLAIASGYAVGHRIATGSLSLIPKSIEDWLPLFSLVASLFSVHESLPKVPNLFRILLRLIFGFAAVATLLFPSAVLSVPPKLAWTFVLGVALAIVWTSLDEISERQTDAVLPLSLSLIAAISSAALFISNSAKLSQLSGVLAAAIGAIFVFCLWQKQWSIAKGGSGVFVSLLFGINVSGMFYANLPLLSAIFFWLAPLSGLVRILPSSHKLPYRYQIVLQVVVAVLLAFIGVSTTVYVHGLPTGGYY